MAAGDNIGGMPAIIQGDAGCFGQTVSAHCAETSVSAILCRNILCRNIRPDYLRNSAFF